jgi:hypothetical protein
MISLCKHWAQFCTGLSTVHLSDDSAVVLFVSETSLLVLFGCQEFWDKHSGQNTQVIWDGESITLQ